jgi:hypothetical protein
MLNYMINYMKIINKMFFSLNRPNPITAYVVLGCFASIILIVLPTALIIRHNCFDDNCQYTQGSDIENPQRLPHNNDSDSETEIVIYTREPTHQREDPNIDGSVVIPSLQHPHQPSTSTSTASRIWSTICGKHRKPSTPQEVNPTTSPVSQTPQQTSTTSLTSPNPLASQIPSTDSGNTNNSQMPHATSTPAPAAIFHPSHAERSKM